MRPKPLIIACCCFFIFSTVSFAQSNLNFGVKGGVNLSTLLDDYGSSSSFLNGPHIGGVAQLDLSEGDEGFVQYALRGELYYSAQGAKDEFGKTNLSYINLPIMIQRYIFSSGFYLETGPQFGFLLAAKSKDEEGSVNIKSQLKPIEVALNVGLGYQFNSGLGISTRVTSGLTSVSKESSVKNLTVGLGLVYIFGKSND